MNPIKLLAAVAASLMASVVLADAPALADPNPLPPPYYNLNGVGTDTTQGVMNALANVINSQSGTTQIASWDSGPAPFEPAVTLTEIPPQQGAAHTLQVTVAQNLPGEVQFFQFDPNPDNPDIPLGDSVTINTPPAGPVATANVGPFTQGDLVNFFAIFYPTDDTDFIPNTSNTTTITGP